MCSCCVVSCTSWNGCLEKWIKTVGGRAVVMETASLAASFQSFLPSDNFLPMLPLWAGTLLSWLSLALIKLSVEPQVRVWKWTELDETWKTSGEFGNMENQCRTRLWPQELTSMFNKCCWELNFKTAKYNLKRPWEDELPSVDLRFLVLLSTNTLIALVHPENVLNPLEFNELLFTSLVS